MDHATSPTRLAPTIGTAAAPLLVDVRRPAAFDASDRMIAGAVRRRPDEIARLPQSVPRDRAVVVYCVHGHAVSQEAAATLRAAGIEASFLEGGIAGWLERGLPTRRKSAASTARWVTRERPKVDRIACPWLIRRFVDPEAAFLYVPAERVAAVAAETGAVPYDMPGIEAFGHVSERCSFDAFVEAFDISDPALARLALIVRGADTGRPDLAPQSAGLLALSQGLSSTIADDLAMLEQGMAVYDAFYAWCRAREADRA